MGLIRGVAGGDNVCPRIPQATSKEKKKPIILCNVILFQGAASTAFYSMALLSLVCENIQETFSWITKT